MASERFTGDVESIRKARQFVRSQLVDVCAQSSDVDDAILITSELASNVVTHALTDFELVVLTTDAAIRIEIHDGVAVSEAFHDLITNPPVTIDVTAVGGRGLILLSSTAHRFGLIDNGASGKAIWFEIDRRPGEIGHAPNAQHQLRGR